MTTEPSPPLFESCSMYYVHCVKRGGDQLYFGFSEDLRRRLKEHGLTAKALVYYEAYKSRQDAIERERQLKRYKSSWGQLKKRIARSRI